MADSIRSDDLRKGKCYSKDGFFLGKFVSQELTGAVHDPDPIDTFEHGVRGGISARYTEVNCETKMPIVRAEAVSIAPAICYQTHNGIYLGRFIKEHTGLFTNGQATPVFQHENYMLVGHEWKQQIWNGFQYIPAVMQVQCPFHGGKKQKRKTHTRRVRKN